MHAMMAGVPVSSGNGHEDDDLDALRAAELDEELQGTCPLSPHAPYSFMILTCAHTLLDPFAKTSSLRARIPSLLERRAALDTPTPVAARKSIYHSLQITEYYPPNFPLFIPATCPNHMSMSKDRCLSGCVVDSGVGAGTRVCRIAFVEGWRTDSSYARVGYFAGFCPCRRRRWITSDQYRHGLG